MHVPDFSMLLAPTWTERVRAEEALGHWLIQIGDGREPWPEPVQLALRRLLPSPTVFLSALVAFWADVCARSLAQRMREFPDSRATEPTWPKLDPEGPVRHFPMTPATAPISTLRLDGMWVWKFMERIGPLASLVELPLLDCLEHPEGSVWSSAEFALGGAGQLSDAGYTRFLDVADKRGRNGNLRDRSQAIARHTQGHRLSALIDRLDPTLSENALTARFGILSAIQDEAASQVIEALLVRLDWAWSVSARADLLWAINSLSRKQPLAHSALAKLAVYATAADEPLRSAVAAILASHDDASFEPQLEALAKDAHPWVRQAVCAGLIHRSEVSAGMLGILSHRCLGDCSGYDGEPHDRYVELLIGFPQAASKCLPEIVRWWDEVTAGQGAGREPIEQGLRLCSALSPYCDLRPMLPGLRRALILQGEEPIEVALPDLNMPGAVPIIRNALEADLLAAGNTPEQAAAWADMQGAVLSDFAAELESLQAQIDADEARHEAEMREFFPERFLDKDAVGPEDHTDGTEDDVTEAVFEAEPDPLVSELEAWICKLSDSP